MTFACPAARQPWLGHLTKRACTALPALQVTLGPGAYSIEETAYWSERVYRWVPCLPA